MKVLLVTNMYPTPRFPYAGTFIKEQVIGLRSLGLNVEVLFLDRMAYGAAVYLTAGRLVRAWVSRLDPDIVHVAYGGVLAATVTYVVKDRPTVVTFHGSDLLGEPLSGWRRQLVARLGVFGSRLAAKRAAGVIVVSPVLEAQLPQIRAPRTRVIPCGVNLEKFQPLDRAACRRRLGWRDGPFYVLFCSSVGNQIKRPQLARAAVDVLKSWGVNAELQQLSGRAHDEVPIWLNASDAILVTSLHEGSPTIVKEALACNVPVVSVDVGDVKDRIGNVEGCHIAESDPVSLASKLLLVYERPGLVDGRRSIEEMSLEGSASRVRAFYSELLGTRPECGRL